MYKKIRKITISCVLMFLFVMSSLSAFASQDYEIVETQTGDESITLYIKGTDKLSDDISVVIGTTSCDDVTVSAITDMDVPMRTLIMIDNSLSIPQESRNSISEILQNLISDRLNNEQISIATFGDKIVYCTDYTDDYSELKTAIGQLEYMNQYTYLTDVLYDVLTQNYSDIEEGIYQRIVIIADGVDNTSLGYTKEELYDLIKNCSVPIYTFGVSTGNNEEQLENMFAISRMTSAEYCVINELENLLMINDYLKADRDISVVKIMPPAALLDGSKKTVQVTVNGNDMSYDVRMPQKEMAAEPETESEQAVLETTVQEQTIEIEEPTTENITTSGAGGYTTLLFILLCVVCVIVLAVIVVIIVLGHRKNSSIQIIDDKKLDAYENKTKSKKTDKNKTTFRQKVEDKITTFRQRNTHCLWTKYQIKLVDDNNPSKMIQSPITDSVTVGRGKFETKR